MNSESLSRGTAAAAAAVAPARTRLARALCRPFPLLVLFFLLSAATPTRTPAEGPGGAVPEEWLTPAERFEYRATPSYDETLAFLRRLEKRLPEMKLEFYGESASGRPMPLVILSAEKAFTPELAQAVAKPVVLVQNGIHAGEIDGKDAVLLLLRDIAMGGRRELLAATTLLIVPIYNVDGHERVSPFNRPNQDGPVLGMGFRTTADGHDLNRDYLKLVTPEARQLVHLVSAWQPHLVVDTHVTDGVDLDWVITWAVPEAPLLAAPVDRWLQRNFPPVLAAVEAAGHAQGPYVSLIDGQDPTRGFETLVYEPRYSTGYFPLRNRPAVLLESHSHKPYRARVLATRDFLAALIVQAGQDGLALKSAIAEAALAVVQQGLPAAPPSTIAVRYERAAPETFRVPFYDWHLEPGVVAGGEQIHYRRGVVRETEVPWFHRQMVAASLPRPRGYLVLPGWPEIERRLIDHGLRFERLPRELELTVEVARLSQPKPAAESYQGETRLAAEVKRALEHRTVPAGALWVPADQPDFAVAVQLLEPEAPDSVLSWGLVSGLFEGKESIDAGALDRFALAALADRAVAAEWESALADPLFAADRGARYRWWFARTPFHDEQVGLYPVLRLMEPLPQPQEQQIVLTPQTVPR
ncbi:MAG: M14 family metallopeptidase [Thermoanaerobaculia bacterium]